MKEHGSHAYLINTGWSGGPYGIGKRMSLSITRTIIRNIHNGEIEKCEFEKTQPFGLWIPKAIKGIEAGILNPRNTWKDKAEYDKKAIELAKSFVKNFENFTDNEEGRRLVAAGPLR